MRVWLGCGKSVVTTGLLTPFCQKVVTPAGFEPATSSLGGTRAIQLCHGAICLRIQGDAK